MPTLDQLIVKIDASTELLRRELNKGDRSVTKFQRNVDRKLGRVDKRFAKVGAGIRTAIGAFGIGIGVVGIASFARGVASAGLELERYERALKFATGSQEGAEREMDFLRETADRLGLDLRALIGSYSSLAAAAKGTNLEGAATRDIFLGISEAATVLGLTAEQTEGALRAIDQMISKGNVQAEELRGQLGERLPGAFQIAARAMGVTTKELNKMLELGDVAADDLLPKLADELHRTFGPEVATASDSATAAINRFNTSIFELKTTIAESGILDLLTKLANAGTAAAEGFQRLENPTDQQRIAQIVAEIRGLREEQERFGNSATGFLVVGHAERIAQLEAEWDSIIARMREANALASPTASTAAQASRFPITDIAGPAASGQPVTVRLGESGGQAPVELEDVRRVNDALRELEQQALRSQGRMAEAIRMSADAQIAEWERVAEETPQFAEKAAEAIRLINEKAQKDIEALDDASPAIQRFADTFAAAFESRGIEALLDGDVSDAVRGLTNDIIELIYRLVILRPLAEKLGGIFGGGIGGIFSGGGIGGGLPTIPGRASGGPVEANKPYFVHQDELFVPDVPGRIFNSAQLSRMSGGVVVNLYQNVQAGLPPQWQEQTFTAAQIAAAAAKESISRELGGRR